MSDDSNKLQTLLSLYDNHATWCRHQESQRATIGSILVSITGLTVLLITYDRELTCLDIYPALFIIVVNLYGIVYGLKNYERFLFHDRRTKKYKEALDSILDDVDIIGIEEAADSAIKSQKGVFIKLRLHVVWMVLFVLLSILGVLLAVAAVM